MIVALPQVGYFVLDHDIFDISHLKYNSFLNLELFINIDVICEQVLLTISAPESFSLFANHLNNQLTDCLHLICNKDIKVDISCSISKLMCPTLES